MIIACETQKLYDLQITATFVQIAFVIHISQRFNNNDEK